LNELFTFFFLVLFLVHDGGAVHVLDNHPYIHLIVKAIVALMGHLQPSHFLFSWQLYA